MAGLVTGGSHPLHGKDEVLSSSTSLFSLGVVLFLLHHFFLRFFICCNVWQQRPPTRQSVSKICRVCGDEIGVKEDGEPFVACHVCGFPVCRPCYEYERSEGNQSCPQCNTRYKRHKGFFTSLF